MQKDESYTKEYWPEQAEHIRRTLLVPGTWLDDLVVLHLFYFMASRKRYTKKQVRLVDSQILCSVLRGDHGSNAEHLRHYLSGDQTIPLILIPLVCGSHWSLLIYRTGCNRWYHADSLRPYHEKLAHDTFTQLHERRLVASSGATLKQLMVPRQREGWECGLYTLQYMLAAISASNRADTNEHQFFAALKEYCSLACDENLLLFTQRLLEEV